MQINHIQKIKKLFISWAQEQPLQIKALSQAGSNRQYFRITSQNKNAIGVYSPDINETKAFISFTKQFNDLNFPVPQLLHEGNDNLCYLISDLGDISLFGHLEKNKINGELSAQTKDYYRQVVEQLPRFQIEAYKNFDFAHAYPSESFDEKALRADLNYFKYYFLKLQTISFNEQQLEHDFDTLIAYLLQCDADYFMYRDFQARNIMIYNDSTWFIDYQGGRRGALQYDLASLLFQVKAALPDEFRTELLQLYLKEIKKYISVDEKQFVAYYQAFVLMRLLQVMGAYGFRGYIERRPHFLQSVPYAIKEIGFWLNNVKLSIEIPELISVLEEISCLKVDIPDILHKNTLTVEINSFSYKKGGIPFDFSGNGGGFVFDCRALPNPGRYEQYEKLTGIDNPVVSFLENEIEIEAFVERVAEIVGASVIRYLERGFLNLQVNFGCTGGQHRSVYCAERLAEIIKNKFPVNVFLHHSEMENIRKLHN